ncbi:hypothetical protein D9613_008603 [Agrocybe pediades]|uniref:Uncharacterized protein n=1 Tax=Agrocybe pediades TaxID=84607 RepID=A0A8H4QT17_9AGAR|nr:hypothetical protein D9613_008603 [Agrocybe pediades]
MGTAWSSTRSYPWEQGLYVGGIETAKVNLTLRIYSNAWHVYAGLAILNPKAREQIERYASSATELFKMMLEGGNGGEEERRRFRKRVAWAKERVFGALEGEAGGKEGKGRRRPILLSEDLLDRFSLSASSPVTPTGPSATSTAADTNTSTQTYPPSPHVAPPRKHRANSHLSLLTMVDCWAHLGINPYNHLELAATPLFRLFLGVAEYLFLSPGPSRSSSSTSTSTSSTTSPPTSQTPLEASLHSALHDTWHRSDDLEFVCAARGWSQAVSFGSFEVYRRRFEETRAFFEVTGRFGEVGRVGGEMIKAVMDSEVS